MPSISKRHLSDGSLAWLAQVRIRPFKPAAKAFPDLKSAKAWAGELEQTLKAQRKRGAVREDLGSLTLGTLVVEFLKDPETQALNYFDDLHRLTCWWVNHYGAVRVLGFNVLTLREAREKLRRGRANSTANRYLSAMRSAWNWARAAGLIPGSICGRSA